ncbi:helicase HerA-like domain-containing protein [Microtetraspora malaysiensis]|uniref:ATP-binding protein n=1 Tax=Microtetraspora malaysiensis TaxID=161358 RepID=UPI003D8E843D
MQPFPLSGPWYRIQAIAAPSRSSSAEWDFVTVLPAVLSAAQRNRPFVIGWLSRGAGAPLELITNAGPLTPPRPPKRAVTSIDVTPTGPQPLLFPGGARGVEIGDEWLADLADLVWTPCPGRQAPPLSGRREPEPDEPKQPTLFESTLVTLMSRPFGWVVVAEPTNLLDAEVAHLRTQLNVLRQYGDASERSRFDAERAERRMQELDAFREAGLWNVRVLAGAAGPDELRQIAPVLVGSVEMSHHPYRLRSAMSGPLLSDPVRSGSPHGSSPESGYGFTEALHVTLQDPADGAAAPFAATAGALAALAGLPRREVPGVRVLDAGFFDVTSEADSTSGETIDLGAIVDGQDRAVGTFRVPLATLNRHAFVTGATGSGKSQTVRHLLEELTKAGIPWLAIEPAKSEYAAMAGRVEHLAPLTVINPSAPDNVPFSVNPLAPEPGYPVQAHIDMVRALFMAAFDAEEPFPQIMSLALQRVYEANGWDVVTGGGIPGAAVQPAVPTLEQLQQHALEVIQEIGYGNEVQADVEGFISLRLRSLRVGSAGRFFEGGHPADIGGLLQRNVVLAIEDVANDEDKAFLMGTLIIRIVEHLRMRARQELSQEEGGGGLRHVIVIEEAHRLLRDRGAQRASTHAVELLAGMLAEIRAYGEGIIVAEQIPTKLVSDVVKNTALKVVHRLPAEDDRQLVGAAMNLSEDQSRQVVSLQPGYAAVFADGMDRPLRVQVPLGEGRERAMLSPIPPICGRRSAACGRECRTGKACTLFELREADLLAVAPEWAWLRIWTDTVVLAFVTNRPLPGVPRILADIWAELPPKRRECLLATLVERCVARRAWSLRTWFDPALLTEKAAEVAAALLDSAAAVSQSAALPSAVSQSAADSVPACPAARAVRAEAEHVASAVPVPVPAAVAAGAESAAAGPDRTTEPSAGVDDEPGDDEPGDDEPGDEEEAAESPAESPVESAVEGAAGERRTPPGDRSRWPPRAPRAGPGPHRRGSGREPPGWSPRCAGCTRSSGCSPSGTRRPICAARPPSWSTRCSAPTRPGGRTRTRGSTGRTAGTPTRTRATRPGPAVRTATGRATRQRAGHPRAPQPGRSCSATVPRRCATTRCPWRWTATARSPGGSSWATTSTRASSGTSRPSPSPWSRVSASGTSPRRWGRAGWRRCCPGRAGSCSPSTATPRPSSRSPTSRRARRPAWGWAARSPEAPRSPGSPVRQPRTGNRRRRTG